MSKTDARRALARHPHRLKNHEPLSDLIWDLLEAGDEQLVIMSECTTLNATTFTVHWRRKVFEVTVFEGVERV